MGYMLDITPKPSLQPSVRKLSLQVVKLPKAAERSQPPFTARIMAADVMLAMMARIFAIDVR